MHEPVMVVETLGALITDRNGIYVDLNLGDGGHGEAICAALEGGDYLYVGIDRDPTAIVGCRSRLERFGHRTRLLQGNHREFPELLDREGIGLVNGILFDLGLSSTQLDSASRGFAHDLDGPLDMRYGDTGPTAADLLATLPEVELARALRELGDVHAAPRLARAICHRRRTDPITTTGDLRRVVDEALHPAPPRRRKVLAQVFQTIRGLTNAEVPSFRDALGACEDRLSSGGVLCVIAYESVTDRMVKRLFHPPDEPRDVFGRPLEAPRWERITRRALRPGQEEIDRNPRARSARLRAARRTRGVTP